MRYHIRKIKIMHAYHFRHLEQAQDVQRVLGWNDNNCAYLISLKNEVVDEHYSILEVKKVFEESNKKRAINKINKIKKVSGVYYDIVDLQKMEVVYGG